MIVPRILRLLFDGDIGIRQALPPKPGPRSLHRPGLSGDKPNRRPGQAAAKGLVLLAHPPQFPAGNVYLSDAATIWSSVFHPPWFPNRLRAAFFKAPVVLSRRWNPSSQHSMWIWMVPNCCKRLLQGTPSGPAAHPDINHMPIPVFFR